MDGGGVVATRVGSKGAANNEQAKESQQGAVSSRGDVRSRGGPTRKEQSAAVVVLEREVDDQRIPCHDFKFLDGVYCW